MGCKRQQVADIAARSGYVRKTAKHITKKQEEHVQRMLNGVETLTHQEIANRVGCTKVQVTNVVTRQKLAKTTPTRLTPKQKEEIITYKTIHKKTYEEIVNIIKCSLPQVKRTIEEFNRQQRTSSSGQTSSKKRPIKWGQEPPAKRPRFE